MKVNLNYLFSALLCAVLIAGILFSADKPKYVYAVREQVNPTKNFIEYELWCWQEYKSGRIVKKYVGDYKLYGKNLRIDYAETSYCKKKGVV